MPSPVPGPVVAILDYPGAQAAAVHGLVDLLETSNRLARKEDPGRPPLEVRVLPWKPGEALPEGPLAALILPPALGGIPDGAPDPALRGWLLRRHGQGCLMCSVCAGAFLLAASGLLEGRAATTHWALREAFEARFPGVRLDVERLLIDEGDLLTAGGLMAWVDLGLRLIHRFQGGTTLLATARHFLVDPGGREQRFYSPFAPRMDHGDAAILRVQHRLHAPEGTGLSVRALAEASRLGERTFLRRFRKATGLAPTAYVQHLRIGRARELLERSDLSQDEVAWEVGYRDTGAFRKVFLRIVGLTPGEYRKRFQV